MKTIDQWDVNEVAVWLHCIGLGNYTDSFLENTVDGGMLLELNMDDLRDELGLSRLQAKKLLRTLKFTKNVTDSPSGEEEEEEEEDIETLTEKVDTLTEENEGLRATVEELEAAQTEIRDRLGELEGEEGLNERLEEMSEELAPVRDKMEELEAAKSEIAERFEEVNGENAAFKAQEEEYEATIMGLARTLAMY
eukprot:CAMPEP_0172492862 /NCGR_PEP_ID=MMETSP1066-20121228/24118_1 /TAXON_ID=671091 /ORGANISM="Coscinodiscus wailesii, Strain CCMP2513" /LENGTH=193 /DNA_ID=CAMNT_0013262703 /DNA_START=67 /DNA_END=648 /DNA_ORIENTATION=-